MQDLIAFQLDFAAALFDPALPAPGSIKHSGAETVRRRFGVYRNNVVAGLISALEARFPVTKRLVSEEFFRSMAREYVRTQPPRSPILLLYGGSFPEFINRFEPTRGLEYLPDLARLEFARGRAYHAADRSPCTTTAFTALDPADLGRSTTELHPSVSLLTSQFPIVSIWEAHQRARVEPIKQWDAEAALIVRPFLDVDLWRLPAGAYAFLEALAAGSTIADAIERSAATLPDLDPAACLSVLIGSHMVVGLIPG